MVNWQNNAKLSNSRTAQKRAFFPISFKSFESRNKLPFFFFFFYVQVSIVNVFKMAFIKIRFGLWVCEMCVYESLSWHQSVLGPVKEYRIL